MSNWYPGKPPSDPLAWRPYTPGDIVGNRQREKERNRESSDDSNCCNCWKCSPPQPVESQCCDDDSEGTIESFTVGARRFKRARRGLYKSADCVVERVEYGWQYRGLWYAEAGRWGTARLTPKEAAEAVCKWLDEELRSTR